MSSTITVNIPDLDYYVKQEPFVGEDGIYIPVVQYAKEGCGVYNQVISKELFVEAYNKWIKEASNA